MQYDVVTPEEYLATLAEDWRKETLLKLRHIILTNGPGLDEFIQYKMLGYGKNKITLFQLNAQRNYVSLYVGDIRKIDTKNELVSGLSHGKGCIRFKKSNSVENSRIEEFIQKAITLFEKGIDTDC